MEETAYIYFLTNKHNTVLYLGVTNHLVRRIAEYKARINKGFAYKYNCDKLVYYESFGFMLDAIIREKQLKNWKRDWKNKLVNEMNPTWKDLSEEIGVNEEWIKAVKEHYAGIAGPARNDVNGWGCEGIAGQARNDVGGLVCDESAGQARNDVGGLVCDESAGPARNDVGGWVYEENADQDRKDDGGLVCDENAGQARNDAGGWIVGDCGSSPQ